MTVTFADILECTSKWSSVLGFVLGIITVWLAGSIKKAVSKTERKAVFNMLADSNIEKLKGFNRDFIQNLESKDKQVVRKNLYSLNTIIDIILRSAPSEFQSKGKKIKKQIKNQYKSYFYWEEEKWYYVCLKKTTKDDMLDTYNRVSDFIDHLENYIKEKNIIR